MTQKVPPWGTLKTRLPEETPGLGRPQAFLETEVSRKLQVKTALRRPSPWIVLPYWSSCKTDWVFWFAWASIAPPAWERMRFLV